MLELLAKDEYGTIVRIPPCDTCEGDGYRRIDSADIDEPCAACHGTGLAGVRWECKIKVHALGDEACKRVDGSLLDDHVLCGLVLVVPLERSE